MAREGASLFFVYNFKSIFYLIIRVATDDRHDVIENFAEFPRKLNCTYVKALYTTFSSGYNLLLFHTEVGVVAVWGRYWPVLFLARYLKFRKMKGTKRISIAFDAQLTV